MFPEYISNEYLLSNGNPGLHHMPFCLKTRLRALRVVQARPGLFDAKIVLVADYEQQSRPPDRSILPQAQFFLRLLRDT